MKRIFALFIAGCLAWVPVPALAAVVLTNLGSATNPGGATTSIVITTVAPVTAHHTIFVSFCAAVNTALAGTPTDTAGDTFAQVAPTAQQCNGAGGSGRAFTFKVADPIGMASGSAITLPLTSAATFISGCAGTIDGSTTLPPTADTVGTAQQGAFSSGSMTGSSGVTPTGSSPYILIGTAGTSAITTSQAWSNDSAHNWILTCAVNNAFHQPAVILSYQLIVPTTPIVFSPSLGSDNTDSWFANEFAFDTGGGSATVGTRRSLTGAGQ